MRNFSGRRVTNRQVIWTSSPEDAIAAAIERIDARGESRVRSRGARASASDGSAKTTGRFRRRQKKRRRRRPA